MAGINIEELADEDAVNLYPNPVKDYLHLDYQFRKVSNAQLVLYNFTGKACYSHTKPNAREGRFSIHVADLPQGVYFAVITTSEGKKAMDEKIPY